MTVRYVRWLVALLVAIPLLSSGCGEGTAPQAQSEQGDTAPDTSTVTHATALITSEGGQLALGGARLRVPAGAVQGSQWITVTLESNSLDTSSADLVGDSYDFQPDGLRFAAPAILDIDHIDGELGLQRDELVLATLSSDAFEWEPLDTWVTETGIGAMVEHFSNVSRFKIINVPQRRSCKSSTCGGCTACDSATGTCRPLRSTDPISDCGNKKQCVELNWDRKHCGECGNRCESGAACTQGTCKCICGTDPATGACVFDDLDALRCSKPHVSVCGECVCPNIFRECSDGRTFQEDTCSCGLYPRLSGRLTSTQVSQERGETISSSANVTFEFDPESNMYWAIEGTVTALVDIVNACGEQHYSFAGAIEPDEGAILLDVGRSSYNGVGVSIRELDGTSTCNGSHMPQPSTDYLPLEWWPESSHPDGTPRYYPISPDGRFEGMQVDVYSGVTYTSYWSLAPVR